MKFIALSVAALATVLTVLPASAQVEIRERGDSARVTINDGRHEGREDRNEGWRRHHADCRVVKVRRTLPSGRVVVTTRRTCE